MKMLHRLPWMFMLLICLLALYATTARAETRSYYTGEAIRAGDLVTADATAKIYYMGKPGRSTEVLYGKGVSKILSAQPLSSSSALVSYQTSGGAYRLIAMTVDSNGKITMGKDVIFSGNYFVLDRTHAVTYNDWGGDIRIVTISGTTLTLGPVAMNIPEAGPRVSLTKLSNDRVLCSWSVWNGSLNGYYLQVYKLSGSQLLPVGNVMPFPSTDFGGVYEAWGRTITLPLSNSRAILRGEGQGRPFAISYAGDSLKTLWMGPYYTPAAVLSDGATVLWQTWDGYYQRYNGAFATCSDEEANVGSLTPIGNYILPPSAVSFSDRVFYSLYNRYSGWIINANGVPTMEQTGKYLNSLGDMVSFTMLNEKQVMAVSRTAANAESLGQLAVRIVPSSVPTCNYIGVAEESVSAGKPCKVTLPGGITRQFSNLITGDVYWSTENGPALEGDSVVGKAVAPNEMMVWFNRY